VLLLRRTSAGVVDSVSVSQKTHLHVLDRFFPVHFVDKW